MPSHLHKQQRINVSFKWPAQLGGSTVMVLGSWDNWQTPVPLDMSEITGDFTRTLELTNINPQQPITYKYLVDDKWRVAPSEPTALSPEGVSNNIRHFSASVMFAWPGPPSSSHHQQQEAVYVVGDWSGWKV
eukprot:jgi/Chrzof1/3510/Cz12g28040.t1